MSCAPHALLVCLFIDFSTLFLKNALREIVYHGVIYDTLLYEDKVATVFFLTKYFSTSV